LALRMLGSPEDRKKTIARATCRAIVERGLHRMNMRDIARALGTTTGPLQHYFASKDELLLYTKNLLVDELLNDAQQAGRKRRGGERLRIVCERLLPFTDTARTAWLVLTAFNGRAIGDSQLTAIQNLRYSKCRQFFEQEIVAAKESGVLNRSVDPALEAIALASFVDGLAVQMLFLSKSEIKQAKAALVPQYLQRSFGLAPGSHVESEVGPDRVGRKPIPIRRAGKA
jgi:TetR/AcrR family transcriptional regulator, transcriptional repressor of bet genes